MDVGRHPNIKLLTNSEIEDISGYVGNFKARVRKRARYVDENECTSCGDCSVVCPVVVPDEFQRWGLFCLHVLTDAGQGLNDGTQGLIVFVPEYLARGGAFARLYLFDDQRADMMKLLVSLT